MGSRKKSKKEGFRKALIGELKKGDVYWWGDPVNGSIGDKWNFDPTYSNYERNINKQIELVLI